VRVSVSVLSLTVYASAALMFMKLERIECWNQTVSAVVCRCNIVFFVFLFVFVSFFCFLFVVVVVVVVRLLIF